jgi:hypothetical protein
MTGVEWEASGPAAGGVDRPGCGRVCLGDRAGRLGLCGVPGGGKHVVPGRDEVKGSEIVGDGPAADAGFPAGIAASIGVGARVGEYWLGRVALKLQAQALALAADEAFRARFIRESRAATAVGDPHVIPVFGAGEGDGLLYIPGLRAAAAGRRAAGLSEQAIRNLIDQGVVRAGEPMTIPAVAPLPMSSASLLPEEDQ